MPAPTPPVDSVLLIGFGGPTCSEEIRPFLQNVARGRDIPEQRLREVEQHYREVGGRSPYNELAERQRGGLEAWLREHGPALPVHCGMRNWKPSLAEVLGTMNRENRNHAVGVILAPHRSEASVDRYLSEIDNAIRQNDHAAPHITFLDPWFDHPRFLEANAQQIESSCRHRRGAWPAAVPVVFTAHSIPVRMAQASPYEADVRASCEGVARLLGAADWELAWQSRSGRPGMPWLEPDILDVLRRRAGEGTREVVVLSIGFLTDHVEVLYDLDVEARALCRELGMELHRAPCVNDHPEFVGMLGELIRAAAGSDGV